MQSKFVVCRLPSSVTLHGGPVEFRFVRATPCYSVEIFRDFLTMRYINSLLLIYLLTYLLTVGLSFNASKCVHRQGVGSCVAHNPLRSVTYGEINP